MGLGVGVLKKQHIQKMNVTEMMMLRWMSGKTFKD